jgi:hypothetical protein
MIRIFFALSLFLMLLAGCGDRPQKFKYGDRVEATSDFYKGMTGTIMLVSGTSDNYAVDFDRKYDNVWVSETDLTLIAP